jgi:hypothetical protein
LDPYHRRVAGVDHQDQTVAVELAGFRSSPVSEERERARERNRELERERE